ncbi:MAG: dTDP-4-dehydrorhamnose 3,5-epimerase [Candidatus Limnocylindria bacterium]
MSTLRRVETRLDGLVLLEPTVHGDARGFFVETYSRAIYRDAGVAAEFVQDNQSRSLRGALRGLHYQRRPGQAKLLRVARGAIWDVAVDIRPDSPTFGQFEAFELDDVNHRQLFVPIGFAHGFCVTSDLADVAYKVSSPYDGQEERGIAWDDSALGIQWPVDDPILSDRDRQNPTLADAAANRELAQP